MSKVDPAMRGVEDWCEGCGGPFGDGPRDGAEYCPKCDAWWPTDPEVIDAMLAARSADNG